MERAYSARLRRWKVRPPGFGLAAAAASIFVSSVVASASRISAGGLLAPLGGIIPARSLWMIFSASSAFAGSAPTSKSASDMLPRCSVVPWQRRQL